jgi:hypothetical protein
MGVKTWAGSTVSQVQPQPPHLQGVKRGTVKGFSRKAANRLRNLLFPLDFEGAFGIALTAPPWATVRPEEAFDTVSRNKSRCPALRALVWRKEVTAKGVPHYHVIAFTARRDLGDLLAVQKWIVTEWARALLPRLCPARLRLCCKAKTLPGDTPTARHFVERVNLGKDNLTLITSANAVQYLADHTSKHKAYQARTTGRAWGVWFKDRLPRVLVDRRSLDELPVRVARRIHKALGKMSRYWVKDAKAPFGYRWSHERRFGGLGSRVLFRPASADALLRLVRYHLGDPVCAPS